MKTCVLISLVVWLAISTTARADDLAVTGNLTVASNAVVSGFATAAGFGDQAAVGASAYDSAAAVGLYAHAFATNCWNATASGIYAQY